MMACAGVSAMAAMELATSGSRCSPTSSPAKPSSQGVVRASLGFALGHEIAVLQQFRSVLLQEPLDRGEPCLLWPDVNIANARCHPRILVSNCRCEQSFKLLR